MNFTLFYPKSEFKFNVMVFFFMTPHQKLVLEPEATIRDNMAYKLLFRLDILFCAYKRKKYLIPKLCIKNPTELVMNFIFNDMLSVFLFHFHITVYKRNGILHLY